MRIPAIMMLVVCAACSGTGRGEHVITWPGFLASVGNRPDSFAVDDSGIYAVLLNGDVVRTSLNGGTPEVVANTGSSVSVNGPIILTADEVIWADQAQEESTGTVRAIPKRGGTVRVIASGQSRPSGLARDTINLYWSIEEFRDPGPSIAAIRSVPIAGGSVSDVVSGAEPFFPFAVGATEVYFGQLSTTGTGFVAAVSKDGSSIRRLADEFALCCTVLMGDVLLWTTINPSRIRSLPIASPSATASTVYDGEATWIATDSRTAFAVNVSCDPVSAGTPGSQHCLTILFNVATGHVLASADQPAYGAAIDSRYAYWMVGSYDLYRISR